MGKEPWCGLMELGSKENGKWDMPVGKELFIMLMGICMKEFGPITSAMGTASTQTKKELATKVSGKMTLNQAKEQKYGQKEANTLVNMKMERSKVLVLMLGQMVLFIREIGSTTELMVLESMFGKMEGNIMETGIIMTCMA